MINGEGNFIDNALTGKNMFKTLRNKTLNHVTIVTFNALNFSEIVTSIEVENLGRQ